MRLCVRVALCVMLVHVMEIRFDSPGVCIISLLGILNLVFWTHRIEFGGRCTCIC